MLSDLVAINLLENRDEVGLIGAHQVPGKTEHLMFNEFVNCIDEEYIMVNPDTNDFSARHLKKLLHIIVR